MPYRIKKCKCKDSKGKTGKYSITKKNNSKQISCHSSRKKAESAIRARHINENIDTITERVLMILLYENSKKEKKVAGSYPEESYQYGWPEFNEKEFDRNGMTTWHEDREWTKQYLKDMGMLK